MDFKDKNVLIFGLGRYPEGSGVSAARFFIRRRARVRVTDVKTAWELRETVSIVKKEQRRGTPVFHLGGHRMGDVEWADFVIRNPGVPNNSPYLAEARRRGIPVFTDVSLFMQLCPCSVLGVTGTRGKSTTTALLGEMMKAANKKAFVGGNLQRSPLTFLEKLDRSSVVVLELSSWLLESLADTKQSPNGAIVTNIYPDHLNVHGSMRAYVRAKENIFRFQRPADVLVLNYDNPYTRRMADWRQVFFRTIRANRRVVGRGGVVWFSMKPLPKKKSGVFLRDGWIVLRNESPGHGPHEHRLLEAKKLAMEGAHNTANALAACALAGTMGIKQKEMKRVLRSFAGLPNRQEIIRVHRGIIWVNDTTATTPEAVMAALERFSQPLKSKTYNLKPRIILIAGGTDKKLKFAALAKAIKKYCKAIILFDGTATEKLKRLLPITNYQLPITIVKSMSRAVRIARATAASGDTVLLSPGAASFGLFKNEFDRGEQFRRAVRNRTG